MSKLNPEQMDYIRRKHAEGTKVSTLSIEFAVGERTIRRIIGVSKPGEPRKKIDDTVVARMLNRYIDGVGIKDICRMYKISEQRLRASVVAHGLALRKSSVKK